MPKRRSGKMMYRSALAAVLALLDGSVGPAQTLRERAFVDRADDVSGYQVHVMYVLPSDGVDQQLDNDGKLETSVAAFARWLVGQTGGPRLRLDSYQGRLDITFFRLSRTDAEFRAAGAFVRDRVEAELVAAGFNQAQKVYAVYYGGSSSFSCGGGAWPPTLPGNVAALYLNGEPPGAAPCNTNAFASSDGAPGYLEFAMIHEIMHTLGFVASCAPHHTLAGHVSDDPRDLMYAGALPWIPSVLDVGRDDYYAHSNPQCLDLAKSAFLDPLPPNPALPPDWPYVEPDSRPCEQEPALRSTAAAGPASIQFVNATSQPVDIYWLDLNGQRQFSRRLSPLEGYVQNTSINHLWLVAGSTGQCRAIYAPSAKATRAVLGPILPSLSAPSTTLTFVATTGGSSPAAQTFPLSNRGDGALNFTVTANQPWLTGAPSSGALAPGATATITVSVSIANLAPAEYKGVLRIEAAGAANSPQSVQINLVVRPLAAPAPMFLAAGVVHAASFAGGPVAPGEIISIFGSNLGPLTGLGAALDPGTGHVAATRGDVTVLFNESPGPLFFVRQDQINVQVPFEMAGQSSARIVVRYSGVSSAPEAVPVVAAAPGIFTVSRGVGQAALLNQDNSVNSSANPAARGTVVQIFLTGQGATSPLAVTGQLAQAPFPSPVLPVAVSIGGRTVAATFSGLAPALAGLLQVNAVVPADTTPADNVPLQVTIGNVTTQPGVTLAVR